MAEKKALTEREKMVSGQLYDASDPELVEGQTSFFFEPCLVLLMAARHAPRAALSFFCDRSSIDAAVFLSLQSLRDQFRRATHPAQADSRRVSSWRHTTSL